MKWHQVSVGPWSPGGAVIPLLSARQVPRGSREADLSALPFPGDFSMKEVQEPQTSGSERKISSQAVPEAKNVTLLRVNSLSFQDLTAQGPCPPLFLSFSQTHTLTTGTKKTSREHSLGNILLGAPRSHHV